MTVLLHDGEPLSEVCWKVLAGLALGEVMQCPAVCDFYFKRTAFVLDPKNAPEFKTTELFPCN